MVTVASSGSSAPRIDNLDGKTVGEVWNGVFKAEGRIETLGAEAPDGSGPAIVTFGRLAPGRRARFARSKTQVEAAVSASRFVAATSAITTIRRLSGWTR